MEHNVYDVVFKCVLLTNVEASSWAIQNEERSVIFAEFASCLAMAIFTDSLASRSLDQRTAAFANVQVFQNLGTALGSAIYALTLLSFQAETD